MFNSINFINPNLQLLCVFIIFLISVYCFFRVEMKNVAKISFLAASFLALLNMINLHQSSSHLPVERTNNQSYKQVNQSSTISFNKVLNGVVNFLLIVGTIIVTIALLIFGVLLICGEFCLCGLCLGTLFASGVSLIILAGSLLEGVT